MHEVTLLVGSTTTTEQNKLMDEELEQNTQATIQNTNATVAATSAGGVTKTTAGVCGMLITAVCFISWINPTFAENQAGIIFSAIAGGVFGVAVGKKL